MENILSLDIELIINSNVVTKSINHKNAIVRLFIDETDALNENLFFEDTYVYWPALRASAFNSGRYLIFTAYTGIADEAGWDYVTVLHKNGFISWEVNRDDKVNFFFKKENYLNAINNFEKNVLMPSQNIILIPKNVILPE